MLLCSNVGRKRENTGDILLFPEKIYPISTLYFEHLNVRKVKVSRYNILILHLFAFMA